MGVSTRSPATRSLWQRRQYRAIIPLCILSIFVLHVSFPKQSFGLPVDETVWSATKSKLGFNHVHPGSWYSSDTSNTDPDDVLSDFLTQRPAAARLSTLPDICEDAPSAPNIMVSIKTGASELATKLPSHLHTLAKCVHPDQFLIFSDYADVYGGHVVHDALKDVSDHAKETADDFKHYKAIQAYRNERADLSTLSGPGSWSLDKWKFLPLAFKMWESAPEHVEWFVFIEADTTLFWNNLLIWLKTLDPTKDIYLGSPTSCCGRPGFAHGGSGYILSRAALAKLAVKREAEGAALYDARWEEKVNVTLWGDEIMTQAMHEAGVTLSNGGPKIQQYQLFDIPFVEERLCRMIVTMHHVTALDVNDFWRFQSDFIAEHGWHEPILQRHVYESFVAGFITVKRPHWKNRSATLKLVSKEAVPDNDGEKADLAGPEKLSGIQLAATTSQTACTAFCQARETCMQWMWKTGRCYVDDLLWLGERDTADDEVVKEKTRKEGEEDKVVETWTSGWLHERVERMVGSLADCENATHIETNLVKQG